MISRKLRNILIGILIAISTIGIGSVILKNNQPKEPKSVYHQVMVIEEENQKVLEEETVVESLQDCMELNVLSVSLNKNIKIEQGDWFKKSKDIQFNLTGEYVLDFSTITNENVQVDNYNQSIKIFSKPLEYKVYFNESQTEFSDTNKAWYVFGDVEISPEHMEQIKANLKDNITKEMDNELKYAEERANKCIQEVLSKLTKNTYQIEIIFVK